MSAHYMNLRKITPDEFITMLPNNFDSDILEKMHLYRYNKTHQPDPPQKIDLKVAEETEKTIENTDPLRPEPYTMSPANDRILRSGKVIKINTYTLPASVKNKSVAAYWSITSNNKTANTKTKTILARTITVNRTPYADLEQYYAEDCYLFHSHTRKMPRPENYHKTKYKSSFQSPLPGYLTIQLDQSADNVKRVKFDKICIKFY